MTLAALAALAALGAILMDGVGTIEARLPPGFKAAASGRPVDVHGVPLFDRIVPDKPGLDRAVFLLVPKNEEHPDNPRTFYIMENKVTVGLYRMFASESGQSSDGAAWEPRSAPPDVDDPLPVMSVRVTEAQAFAAWIAGPIGFLPSIEQWNKAAGHCPQDRGSRVGPFRSGFSPDDEHAIGINRGDKGPLPAGSATHDVAEPYGCRDMAGNGFEWTRNIAYAEGDSTIPLAVDPIPFTQVVVRGKSFAGSGMEPLTYEDLEPTAPPEANNYFEGDPFTGFRVVLDWPE
jgi:formylglycine-generating enzyme required for sulfatase activity